MKRRELLIHPTTWVGLKNSVLSRNQTQEYILCNYLYEKSFPGGSDGKESTCNAGDLGLIPGLGRSPGEGNSNSLQYSCLENSMDIGDWQSIVHGVPENQPQLRDFHLEQPRLLCSDRCEISLTGVEETGEGNELYNSYGC